METEKKKILIFSTAYMPFIGGAEVAIKEITDRLSGDFDFDLITAKLKKGLPKVEKVGGVTVYRVGSGIPSLDKILLPIRGALLAGKLNKKNNYFCFWGVMVSFSSLAGFVCNSMRSITAKKKVPMILTLQEGDSEEHLTYKWFGLIGLSWKMALRRTDVLTAISNFLLNRASRNGFKGKSFLVPNGVDLKIYQKPIEESVQDDLKNKLGKKEGDIFLVTVSRLTHKNATDDVITSLVSLPKNIKFIIIGKGEEGPRLQKLANALGVTDRVKFVGFIPYEQIPEYHSICDIFIRPSRSEGFGNAFIEAMAAGLPVIATPVGGIVDFIDDKETGLFCPPNSPQGVSSAVMTLLGDNSLRERLIVQGRARVVERYNWDHIAPMQKSAFDSLSK